MYVHSTNYPLNVYKGGARADQLQPEAKIFSHDTVIKKDEFFLFFLVVAVTSSGLIQYL